MTRNKAANKALRRTASVLLLLFVLFNIIMAFNAWKFTHYYDDPDLRLPQPKTFSSGLGTIVLGKKQPKHLNDSFPSVPYSRILIETRDGLTLETWSMTPAITPSFARGHVPTILLFHGQGSCKSAILQEAYSFLKFGYPVVLVDFRAHGGSAGSQTTIGIKECEDVRCAYEYVKKETGSEPILFGVSMGAASIARAIAQYDLHPSKVILEMPFGSLNDAVKGFIRTHMKGVPVGIAPFLTFWGSTLNGGWGFSHNPATFVKKINCPTLLEWGALDARVTREEIDEVYSKISSREKRLVVYETAGHQSFCRVEHTKWEQTVGSFLGVITHRETQSAPKE